MLSSNTWLIVCDTSTFRQLSRKDNNDTFHLFISTFACLICCPFISFLSVQLVLPIINNDHWSLYIVYLNKGSFDILDSNNYDLLGGKESQHRYPLARKVLKRLNDGFQRYMPKKFKKFGNFHHEYVNCPNMVPCSNDCAFYVMRYMERYRGKHEKLADEFTPVDSRVLRAQILHQLIFHHFNLAACIHPDIELLRPIDDDEGSSQH